MIQRINCLIAQLAILLCMLSGAISLPFLSVGFYLWVRHHGF